MRVCLQSDCRLEYQLCVLGINCRIPVFECGTGSKSGLVSRGNWGVKEFGQASHRAWTALSIRWGELRRAAGDRPDSGPVRLPCSRGR